MKSKLRLLLTALLCLCACLLFSPTAFAEGGGENCDVILTESWADFAAWHMENRRQRCLQLQWTNWRYSGT